MAQNQEQCTNQDSCPQCLDSFSECGHVMCQRCLQTYQEKNRKPDSKICPDCTHNERKELMKELPFSPSTMAEEEHQMNQGLICPLCLDTFRNPRLLTCGHSFCKACLERYDSGLDYMSCPVCKRVTELTKDGIEALSPNFLFKGIEDGLPSMRDVSFPKFCSIHNQTYMDIICEDCQDFICLTCYIDGHLGHNIKKKEELEMDLKRKRNALVQMSQIKKKEIDKAKSNAEENKHVMRSHFYRLEREIHGEFAKKKAVLDEERWRVLKKLETIEMEFAMKMGRCFFEQLQLFGKSLKRLDNVDIAIKCTDFKALAEMNSKLQEMEEAVQKMYINDCTEPIRKSVESLQFCPADEKSFEIGQLKLIDKFSPCSGLGHCFGSTGVSNDDTTKMNVKPKIGADQSNELTIVRTVVLPYIVSGMAALSKDEVIVGYGYDRDGTECISVTGNVEQHLRPGVGEVHDIAVMTDGKLVVAHDYRCCLYSQDGQKMGAQFTYRTIRGRQTSVCTDHQDRIYIVSGSPEIYIYLRDDQCPLRVEHGLMENAVQICVTKSGALITNTEPGYIKVYFRGDGPFQCCGKGVNSGDCLFAAVDCDDRVLIATKKPHSHAFSLARYTFEPMKLTEEIVYKPLELPYRSRYSQALCYMVSLTPTLIAFANENCLYFIKLPC